MQPREPCSWAGRPVTLRVEWRPRHARGRDHAVLGCQAAGEAHSTSATTHDCVPEAKVDPTHLPAPRCSTRAAMGAVGWPGRLLRPTAGQRIVPRALCRVLLCLAMAPVAVHVVRAQMPSSPSGGARLLQSLPRERKSVVTAEDILGPHPRSVPASGREGLDEIHRRLHGLVDDEDAHADAGAWEKDVSDLQQRVVVMFYHAYDNYMLHAFPHDELLPLSCHYVDNFGSYALTLIDSLDMLAVLGNRTEFTRAVGLLKEHLSFDVDVSISVFETNIRVMGGLLSAHVLASDASLALMPSYDGCLLDMALDLGERLLPAFDTPTGIPYGTVNMRHGVNKVRMGMRRSVCVCLACRVAKTRAHTHTRSVAQPSPCAQACRPALAGRSRQHRHRVRPDDSVREGMPLTFGMAAARRARRASAPPHAPARSRSSLPRCRGCPATPRLSGSLSARSSGCGPGAPSWGWWAGTSISRRASGRTRTAASGPPSTLTTST